MNSPYAGPILRTPSRKSSPAGGLLSEPFFRLFLESIPDRFCVLDRHGIVVYVSRGAAVFSTLAEDESKALAVGANYLAASEAMLRAGMPLAKEHLNGILAVLQGRQAHFELHYAAPAKDGGRNTLMTADPMPVEHGGVIIRTLEVGATENSWHARKPRNNFGRSLPDSQLATGSRTCIDKKVANHSRSPLERTSEGIDQRIGSQGLLNWDRCGDTNCVSSLHDSIETPLEPAANRIDIASFRQLREALHLSAERLHLLANLVPAAIWVTDSKNRRIYLNNYWQSTICGKPGPHLGLGWLEDVHAEDRARVSALAAEAAITREPYAVEYRVSRSGGRSGWCLDAALPQFRSNGAYAGHIGSSIDITERKESEQARAELNERLILAQECERKRIARELHDDISQSLALCALSIDEILGGLDGSQSNVRSQIIFLHRKLEMVMSDVYRISHNLHPSKLVQLGLVPSLRRLSKDFSAHKDIDVIFHSENVPSQISEQTTIGLFRVAQECLNNIAKHSGAHSATLSLKGAHEGIELTISDPGRGFDSARLEESSGLGIHNMRERVRIMGGSFRIKSKPRCGTRVTAWISAKS
jgi:PAS domain S-box-containing protein